MLRFIGGPQAGEPMRRREFITALGGAAVAWPIAARAQENERMRRIGALMSTRAGDPLGDARLAAFLQGFQSLGWADGRNVRIDIRWTAGNADDIRKFAAELVALSPEVILASGGSVVGPLLQATRTVPVVFTQTPDPVAAGFVASLARPGGNATGFTQVEYGTGAKWLELLKEIAPRVARAAVLRDPAIPEGIGQFAVIQSVAPSFGIEVSPVDIRDAGEIERAVKEFARSANGGLIVTSSGLANVHRNLIVGLAAKLQLPAIYSFGFFVSAGGLISYGSDSIDPHRSAAGYVDRILKGEKPADLPVQAPTKYEMVINLKTAKALGLEVPPTLLTRADEVIE
jgi:putative ABC transport system substrate-binding protein